MKIKKVMNMAFSWEMNADIKQNFVMEDLKNELNKFTSLLSEGLARVESFILNVQNKEVIYDNFQVVKKWTERELNQWYARLVLKLAKKKITPAQYKSMQETISSLNQITRMFLQEEINIEKCDEFLSWVLESPHLLESNLYLEELPNLVKSVEHRDDFLKLVLELPYLLKPVLCLEVFPCLEWRKFGMNIQPTTSSVEYDWTTESMYQNVKIA